MLVKISLGDSYYPALEVPEGCTVGLWKQLVDEGLLGHKIVYADRLRCRDERSGAPLGDDSPLPALPAKMEISGPDCVVKMVEMALTKKLGSPEIPQTDLSEVVAVLDTWEEVCRGVGASTVGLFPRDERLSKETDASKLRRLCAPCYDPRGPREKGLPDKIGDYLVCCKVGEGMGGGMITFVYLAEHKQSLRRAVVKWPVSAKELAVWRQIQKQLPDFPGLPQLWEHGIMGLTPFAVMEPLGRDLTEMLPALSGRSISRRWRAARVLGRLALRRLKAVHSSGYVHCDVSPYNFLFGKARDADRFATIYLIDFGLVQALPGNRLGGEHGTTEFCSTRALAGNARVPHDDLEALGWMLVWLLFSDLPWCEWCDACPEPAGCGPARTKLLARVRAAKLQILGSGWGSMGAPWRKLEDIPVELQSFFEACQWEDAVPAEPPDYVRLDALLGGRGGLDAHEAEAEDLREFQAHTWPLL